MPDDASLDCFQSVLLDLLAKGQPPERVLAQLRSNPRLAEYADYIATFEPRMVEVASALVAKWGRRDGGNLAPLDRD